MKYLIAFLLTTLVHGHSYSQKDPSVLIGKIYRNFGAELHPEAEKSVDYRLFTKSEELSIGTYHPVGCNNREVIDSVSNIYLDSIRPYSEYWGSWTDIYEDGFYYSGSDVYPYDRIYILPYPVYQKLYYSGKIDSRDYLQEFLNVIIKSICRDQLVLFDSVNGNKIGILNSNDLVEILQEESDWIKIKSLKTGVIGWVYDSCLE